MSVKRVCYALTVIDLVMLCALKLASILPINIEIILWIIALILQLFSGLHWLISGWISDYQHRVK